MILYAAISNLIYIPENIYHYFKFLDEYQKHISCTYVCLVWCLQFCHCYWNNFSPTLSILKSCMGKLGENCYSHHCPTVQDQTFEEVGRGIGILSFTHGVLSTFVVVS